MRAYVCVCGVRRRRRSLKNFLQKEQDAYRIFHLMDSDDSQTLDTAELMLILEFFKKHFEKGDKVFKTAAEENAELKAAADAADRRASPWWRSGSGGAA